MAEDDSLIQEGRDLFKSASELMTAHATRIGHAVIAWNRLHDNLGVTFADLINPDQQYIGLTVWHAMKSDSAQRDVLTAVIKTVLPDENKYRIDLCWILTETGKLSGHRNNYIHAAFISLIDDGGIKLIPDHFTGNRKAGKLVDTDLDRDLSMLEQDLSQLEVFLSRIRAFHDYPPPHDAWPDRPQLLRTNTQQTPQSRTR